MRPHSAWGNTIVKVPEVSSSEFLRGIVIMPLTLDKLQIQFDDCKMLHRSAGLPRVLRYRGTSYAVCIPNMTMLMEVQHQEVPLILDINKYIDI